MRLALAALFLALALPKCNIGPPLPPPSPPPITPPPTTQPPPTTLPSPPIQCADPQGTPASAPGNPVMGPTLDASVKLVRLENPSLFDAQGNLTPWPQDPTNPAGAITAHTFYLKVQNALAFGGHCGTLGTDDIGVLEPSSGSWEWYKLVVYTVGKVRAAADSTEGIFVYPGGSAPPSPPATPPATPPPSPTPGPSPSSTPGPAPPGKCPLQLPIPSGYGLALEIKPGGQQADGTPYVFDAGANLPPPGWTGICRGPHRCDIGAEKDRLNGDACSRELCGETLTYTIAGDGFINWPFADGTRPPGVSPYGVKFTLNSPTSQAILTGCCPVSGVCGSVQVP